ncbi:helix-turn-helix domain-containing protein [Streptomyces sp. NPDC001833]|uniref:helix-turn-helix domain-containing protein n=1 Tax=Streptomyces sp. NPDC001833 TaxID=3154658 RepID=UPI003325A342
MRYWTTTDLPRREQFSYWQDVLCQAFTPLAVQRARGQSDAGISSWVRSAPLTATNCAEVASRTQMISHGRAEVGRTTGEHVFVNLMLRGTCVVSQDGRRTLVPTGGFSLVDTTREYHQEYLGDQAGDEWRVLSFRLPRSGLIPLLANPDGFTARAHDGRADGMANVVVATMASIWRNLGHLGRSGADSAETALTAVLAAAAGGNGTLRESRRDTLDAELRAAINRHIRANLRGPADLSAPSTARRFCISVRKLHGLYQGTELTYAQTVMALRVEACARDLAAEAPAPSLTHLAAKWGFCDLSHLNRVFRARYQCLPSQFRQVRAAG